MANEIWVGGTNPPMGDDTWGVAANWNTGAVPQSGDDVSIPSGTPISPEMQGLTTTVQSVTVSDGASLYIAESSFTVTGDLVDNGGVGIDNTFLTDSGGSTLAIGGTLTVTNAGAGFAVGNRAQTAATTVTVGSVTNTGTIAIAGNANPEVVAQIDVASAAGFGGMTGVLTGNVDLGIGVGGAGGPGDALLDFIGGGLINTIENGTIQLTGPNAYIASGSATSSNSALAGPLTISGSGFPSGGLILQAGASVSTGALTDAGSLAVDTAFEGTGGSSVTVNGLLTVSGNLSIGRSAMTNASGTVTATGGLSNSGTIALDGDTTTGFGGILDIDGAAGFGTTGVLSGNVSLIDLSLLDFTGGGQITTIDTTGNLYIQGPNAFLASGTTGADESSNSALTGLTTIDGYFTLQAGATLTTNNGLSVGNGTNGASLNVDTGGAGGSTLNIVGALTLNSYGGASIGNNGITAATTVTASALDFAGTSYSGVSVLGGTPAYSGTAQSTLSVASAAGFGQTGVLSGGDLTLQGIALLDFTDGGQITSTAFGANLTIDGADAFLASGAATSSNSALEDLTQIGGDLTLLDSASVTTDEALTIGNGTNGANVEVDSGASLTTEQALTLNGTQNTLSLFGRFDTSSSTVTAASLSNAGGITINGNPGAGVEGTLDVTGGASNIGQIAVNGGVLEIAGALTGDGSISLSSGALLQVGTTATGGGSIAFTSGSTAEVEMDGAAAPADAISGFGVGDAIDLAGLAYKTSYEAVFYPNAGGGVLEVVDTAAGDSVVAAVTLTGSLSGGLATLAQDASGGTDISFQGDADVTVEPGDVVVSGITGQPYSAYEELYNGGVYAGIDYFFTNVTSQPYSSYTYDYSPGNNFVGSEIFYTTVPTGANYTGYEYDYDGGGNVTRVDVSGVTGAGYSSYEYDYVGGVFAGSKFEVTTVATGATYSSYELDYNSANVFSGDKFFFTNVSGQSYTGLEEDFDASGNLARVLLTGFTGQGYSSLEEDFSAATYTGYKAYYTGITGQSYTGVEVDVSATNQLEKVVYTGMSSTPYSSVEEDFSNGSFTGTVYDFTNVTGPSYYAYQVEENASGAAQQEILDNNDGSHTIIGLGAAGQTFTSIADDTFTGGGASETFVFQPIYGSDTITDFASYLTGATHDTISLSTSEFANFAAVLSGAQNVGANVVITAPTGDTLTLDNMTTTALAANPGDFTFHA
jgi:hypothetical protein